MKFYKDAARKTYERDQKTSDLVREILETCSATAMQSCLR